MKSIFIVSAVAATLAVGIPASAQDTTHGMSGMTDMNGKSGPATDAYMKAMQSMNDKMKEMTTTGDPNKDFVMMMKPHHQAAVDMAEAYLKYGSDPKLTKMAHAIIKSQEKEIEEMSSWEAKHKK